MASSERTQAALRCEYDERYEEAAALYEEGGDLHSAVRCAQKANLPLLAGRLYERLGATREALLAYRAATEDAGLADSAESPATPELLDAVLCQSRLLLRCREGREAARLLQRVLRRPLQSQTDQVPLLQGLHRALLQLGHPEAARLCTLRLLALGVESAEATESGKEAEKAPDRPQGQTKEVLRGRYEIQELIGSGGMGRVYRARDLLEDRIVALKVVSPPEDDKGKEAYRRFLKEAQVVRALRHPAIVTLYEVYEPDGVLVMEYLEGALIDVPLPLPQQRVKDVLLQVLSALQAAHLRGVIHRDVKPQNVFVGKLGEIKLGDFGVAHLHHLGLTQTAGFVGTLAYMSPEQITLAPLTFAADLYSLTAMAYQLLTGRLPFPGPDFVGQHLSCPVPPLRDGTSQLAQLADGWEAFCQKGLAKDPAERFGSLDQMRGALLALSLPSQGPSQGPSQKTAANQAAPAPKEPQPEERPRYQVLYSIRPTPPLQAPLAQLVAATDLRLGRQVFLEELPKDLVATELGQAHLHWVKQMAKHGGPALQRVLSLSTSQQGTVRIVYDAPPSIPWPETQKETEDPLGEVLLALEPLHQQGLAHGAVDQALRLSCEPGTPPEKQKALLLLCGHGPLYQETRTTPEQELHTLRTRLRRGW